MVNAVGSVPATLKAPGTENGAGIVPDWSE